MKRQWRLTAPALTLPLSCAASDSSALPTSSPAMICNSCSNITILQRLNEELPYYNSQYVIDFNSRRLRRFVRNGGSNTFREITVDQADLNYFNLVLEFRDKNSGSLSYLGDIDIATSRSFNPDTITNPPQTAATIPSARYVTENISARDVADSGVFRRQVQEHLNGSQSSAFWQKLAENLQMAVSHVGILFGINNPNDVRIGIRDLAAMTDVHFSDGSKSQFSWNPFQQSFQYVAHSSIDSNGNIIPDTADDVTGGNNQRRTYYFPGSESGSRNANLFVNRVKSWNVQRASHIGLHPD